MPLPSAYPPGLLRASWCPILPAQHRLLRTAALDRLAELRLARDRGTGRPIYLLQTPDRSFLPRAAAAPHRGMAPRAGGSLAPGFREKFRAPGCFRLRPTWPEPPADWEVARDRPMDDRRTRSEAPASRRTPARTAAPPPGGRPPQPASVLDSGARPRVAGRYSTGSSCRPREQPRLHGRGNQGSQPE